MFTRVHVAPAPRGCCAGGRTSHRGPRGITAGLQGSLWARRLPRLRPQHPPHPAPRSSTHILSKSTLYCSSPRPPSTSWSSLVMISFSNCNHTDSASASSVAGVSSCDGRQQHVPPPRRHLLISEGSPSEPPTPRSWISLRSAVPQPPETADGPPSPGTPLFPSLVNGV